MLHGRTTHFIWLSLPFDFLEKQMTALGFQKLLTVKSDFFGLVCHYCYAPTRERSVAE
jgi:hypothetical protein